MASVAIGFYVHAHQMEKRKRRKYEAVMAHTTCGSEELGMQCVGSLSR